MKSKKDLLYEHIRRCTSMEEDEPRGFTTAELADALGMQRTNLSTLLNELVKAGTLEKLSGRPVLYRLPERAGRRKDESCFRRLIGWDGSLRHMVQLAKAAILYPENSLHTLILGPAGSGKSYFASLMADFARENGIIAQDAPFVKFNCRHYEGKESEQEQLLFGSGNANESIFHMARGGVLFLDHIDLLAARVRGTLLDRIESESSEVDETIVICAADDSEHKSILDTFTSKFPVRIDMPPLQARSLEERFSLVQKFFIDEALRMNKTLQVNAELLRCVLLYRCEHNVKQLHSDIRIGCANAYVREFNRGIGELSIYMNDFPAQVRKGFLYYREARDKVESLIPHNYSYTFSSENMEKVYDLGASGEESETIYDVIDRKVSELRARGIQEEDISTIINADLEYDLKQMTSRLGEGNLNKESILKLVDRRIVNLTEKFMQEASTRLERVYPESTFYGLCLHLSAMLDRLDQPQRISNTRIMEVVENHRDEYAFCKKFASQIEKEFEVKLPIDEVVFVTMFLCDKSMYTRLPNQLVILIAMHGDSTASSIAGVVNSIMRCDNTYAFDLPLDKDMRQAYEELRSMVQEIDEGKGILMLYDMGSLNTMAETVAKETGITIRTMMIPSTLIALDCSRKAGGCETLDELYQGEVELYMNSYLQLSHESVRQQGQRVIVTVCQSGKGGALQMKNYLEKHLSLEGVEVVPLAISNRKYLLNEINRIKKDRDILYVIGTYDPKLHGIPFIPVARLFEAPTDKLELLLTLDVPQLPNTIEFTAITEYLAESLEGMDVKALEKLLPTVIARIKKAVSGLSQDQELGLYMHIACALYRMQQGGEMPLNVNRVKILSRQKRLCNDLRDFLKPLEDKFQVAFGDDELAHIIGIIKQL